jgi:hypothetical protein
MKLIEKARDAVGLGLSFISIYASYTLDEQAMHVLPYLFFPFFLLDLPFTSNVTFKVHHTIGIMVSVYSILVAKTPTMMAVTFGTEWSTPVFYALYYLPKEYRPVGKFVFFNIFYACRIHNYGAALMQYDAFEYPYAEFGLLSLYSLFGMNLFWISCMIYKMSLTEKWYAFFFVYFYFYCYRIVQFKDSFS